MRRQPCAKRAQGTLSPTVLCSLGENKWKTLSAETEADRHVFEDIISDTKTSSSLLDTSDSSNLSLLKGTPYPFRVVKVPVLQHPAHPRHNHISRLGLHL